MKYVYCALLLFALIISSHGSARTLQEIKAGGSLRVAVPGDIPGFNMSANGRHTGYEPELIQAVADSLGVAVSYRQAPIDTYFSLLKSDQVDIAVGALDVTSTLTKQAAEQIEFSAPIACSPVAITSKNSAIRTKMDLIGKRIGVLSGSADQEFAKGLTFNKTVIVYPTSQEIVFAMLSGKADATFSYSVMEFPLKQLLPKEKIYFGEGLWTAHIGVMLQKGNTSVLQAVNESVSKFMQTPAYTMLSKKYFDRDVRCAK